MNIVRVSLLQMQLLMNRAEALKRLNEMLTKAASADADIVCLPELWYPKVIKRFDLEFSTILDLAKEYNMIIISGAFLERIDDKLFVSCPVVATNGGILGRQLKIHPFGVQKKYVNGGTKTEIFEIGGLKFGVVICYDIVFPEVARSYIKKGADILFLPSKITNEGIKPWHMYIQVRALENRVPIAAPNVCDNNKRLYNGKSICVDFDYDDKTDVAIPILRQASIHEQILVVDVNLKRSKKMRKRRFKDFKSELYYTL